MKIKSFQKARIGARFHWVKDPDKAECIKENEFSFYVIKLNQVFYIKDLTAKNK